MRSAVLILAVLGTASSALLGQWWLAEYGEQREQIESLRPLLELEPSAAADLGRLDARIRGGRALIIAALLGTIGVVLVGVGRHRLGALPLIAGGALPAFFELETLIFGGLLIVAGLAAWFLKPKETYHPHFRRSDLLRRHS